MDCYLKKKKEIWLIPSTKTSPSCVHASCKVIKVCTCKLLYKDIKVLSWGFYIFGQDSFLFKIIFYLVNFILFIFIAILTFSIKIITTLLVVLCKGNDGIYTACLLQGLVPYNDYILDGSIYKNSVLSCRFALLLAYNSLPVS